MRESQPEIPGSRHKIRRVGPTSHFAKLVLVFEELLQPLASGSAPDFEFGDVSRSVFGEQMIWHSIPFEIGSVAPTETIDQAGKHVSAIFKPGEGKSQENQEKTV